MFFVPRVESRRLCQILAAAADLDGRDFFRIGRLPFLSAFVPNHRAAAALAVPAPVP